MVGNGCQLNRRHCQTVGASRTERSAARQVGDIVERTEVLQCESECLTVYLISTFHGRLVHVQAVDYMHKGPESVHIQLYTVTHLRAAERHLTYGITQSHLPPDTGERVLP